MISTLLKIHPDGSLVWNKTYGGVQSEKAYSMTKAADGYVLVGEVESQIRSTDAWVLKVDENGNEIWNITVGGKEADSPAYVNSVERWRIFGCWFHFLFWSRKPRFLALQNKRPRTSPL